MKRHPETEDKTLSPALAGKHPPTAAVTLVARILVQPERPHMAQVLGMGSLHALAHTERDRKTGIELGGRVDLHKDEGGKGRELMSSCWNQF